MPSGRIGGDYRRSVNSSSKVVPFKKKRNYKNFFITVLLFIVVLVVLLFTPIFNINKIEVANAQKFTQEEIIKMSGIPLGQNIFKVNYFKAKANIQSTPYIAKAEISRNYPGKVVIKVEERKTAAYFQFPGSFLIIDKNGMVLEVANSNANIKAPVILGLKFKDYKVGELVNAEPEDSTKLEILKTCLSEIEATGLAQFINKIDVNNTGQITAWAYNDKYQINLGDGQKLAYKFLFSKDVLDKREKEKSTGGTVDFVSNNRAFFKPR